jgi:hypothetical protein
MMMDKPAPTLRQRCNVYPVHVFRVDVGAMLGEPLDLAQATCAGDVYVLHRTAQIRELVLVPDGAAGVVDTESEVGRPGDAVQIVARHAVISERGNSVEILLLDVGGTRCFLPLGPLVTGEDYTLLSSDPVTQSHQLADVASVSFTRGTRVTMGNGLQMPVERLVVGDRLLTRDHGPQPIRWIGRQTVRAEGQRATVVITKDALNNANDLILSPDHRLFIYQRRDVIGAGRAEVLVRARHLVNGETIFLRDAAHVEYFHILFDKHEIIYVEGIQAESLLVSADVMAGFDADLAGDMSAAVGDLRHVPARGAEPSARDLEGFDAAAALRRASTR